MALTPRYLLSEFEKDALLEEQSALIDRQAAVIDDMRRRISELEAAVSKPKKTSRNSSKPPSSDGPEVGSKAKSATSSRKKKPRPPRAGVSRRLSESPNETVRVAAQACDKCGADVSGQAQGVRHRYDHIEIPPVLPFVTRIELMGGRCGCCNGRFKATPPADMPPGTPFGPRIQAFLAYLHHTHHVGFERLARLMKEMFGLSISEGAINNAFARLVDPLKEIQEAIKAKLRQAKVIASDETTSKINGETFWQWTFVSQDAILHEIAPSRSKAVAEGVLGDHRPEVWVSDRYCGQQDLAAAHQVCLAHVLRDVQYAIDHGDAAFAPKLRDLLRWTIRVAKRRDRLKDTTLAQYHAKADRRLDLLLAIPVENLAGLRLQAQVKAWRTKFFVFLEDRRVPSTNNESEREIRPSVVTRKVTGGFRSPWGAGVHAGYRTLVSSAKLMGSTALQALTGIFDGSALKLFAPTT